MCSTDDGECRGANAKRRMQDECAVKTAKLFGAAMVVQDQCAELEWHIQWPCSACTHDCAISLT